MKFKRSQSDYEKAHAALKANPDNEDLKEDAAALVGEERQKQEELGKQKNNLGYSGKHSSDAGHP